MRSTCLFRFNFGVVMWEVLTRKVPYHDRRNVFINQLKKDVMAGLRPEVPTDSPTKYVELMKECWRTEPHRRPTFCQIVQRLEEMHETYSTWETEQSCIAVYPAVSDAYYSMGSHCINKTTSCSVVACQHVGITEYSQAVSHPGTASVLSDFASVFEWGNARNSGVSLWHYFDQKSSSYMILLSLSNPYAKDFVDEGTATVIFSWQTNILHSWKITRD